MFPARENLPRLQTLPGSLLDISPWVGYRPSILKRQVAEVSVFPPHLALSQYSQSWGMVPSAHLGWNLGISLDTTFSLPSPSPLSLRIPLHRFPPSPRPSPLSGCHHLSPYSLQ